MHTRKLAEKINELTFEMLPADVIERAKETILDTVGVTLAGSKSESADIINAYVDEIGGREEAILMGRNKRTSAAHAALVNGATAHVLDYDDVSWSIIGHPAIVTVFPSFALAEKFKSTGRDVLSAFIAGYETAASIGRGLIPEFCEKGWHSTAAIGVFGATGAAGKLFGLNPEKMRRALGIAGSLASGVKINMGTMTKHLHAGNAASNGIRAASLASKGYTASEQILEGKDGFCHVLAPRHDLDEMVERFGNPFDLVESGAIFKKWPSCFETHPTIEAVISLAEENDIVPDQVQKIRIGATPLVVDVLFYKEPKTPFEAKFSAQFCAAVSLMRRQASLEEFTDRWVFDPHLKELMQRVELFVDPELSEGGYTLSQDEGFSKSRVEITLKNGKRLFREIAFAKGEPQRRLELNEIMDKYRHCAGYVLENEKVNRSIELIMNLEQMDDILPLMEILKG